MVSTILKMTGFLDFKAREDCDGRLDLSTDKRKLWPGGRRALYGGDPGKRTVNFHVICLAKIFFRPLDKKVICEEYCGKVVDDKV